MRQEDGPPLAALAEGAASSRAASPRAASPLSSARAQRRPLSSRINNSLPPHNRCFGSQSCGALLRVYREQCTPHPQHQPALQVCTHYRWGCVVAANLAVLSTPFAGRGCWPLALVDPGAEQVPLLRLQGPAACAADAQGARGLRPRAGRWTRPPLAPALPGATSSTPCNRSTAPVAALTCTASDA